MEERPIGGTRGVHALLIPLPTVAVLTLDPRNLCHRVPKTEKLDRRVYRELPGDVANPQRVCKPLLYGSLTPEPPNYFGYYR
jgi:hypothetical protein